MKKLSKVLSLILIFITSVFLLTACVPSDINSAKDKMEEAGYYVKDYTGYEDGDGIVGAITAIKVSDGIVAIYFNSSQEAKAYADGWVDSKFSYVKYEGRWAYAGTKKAIEDFTK